MSELTLIAKATLVLGLALLVCGAARSWQASVRASFLAWGFAALLALPIASLALSPRTIAVPVPTGLAAPATALSMKAETTVSDPNVDRLPMQPRTYARAPGPDAASVLRALWALGVLLCAVRILVAARRVRRIRIAGVPWNAPGRPSQVPRRVAVFTSADLASPMMCGAFRPAIGFPADAPAWDAADIDRAMTHELEHVRRHDWFVLLLAETACALYWFHPLAWIAARRLRLDTEHACDDAVVRDAGHVEYAQQLVAMARRLSSAHVAPLPSMVGRSSLATRVRAVLDTARPRGPVSGTVKALAAAAALMMVATLGPVHLAGQISKVESLSIPTSVSGPVFDTVSIHDARPDDGPPEIAFEAASGRLIARRQTLRTLITFAYAPMHSPAIVELPDARLSGGPEWIGVDEFTVEATTGRAVTSRELQTMLRRLLVAHFSLAVHTEAAPTPAYRLVRAAPAGVLGPRLRPAQRGCVGPIGADAGLGSFELRCATMAAMAESIHLSEVLGRPVVDRTSLSGVYDISLAFAPTRDELSTIYELPPDAALAPELTSRPTIFAAFEQQLGLRLESTDAALDVLVIDWAARPVATQATR